MTHCQDGLQVYFATETQEYDYVPIYGYYELQPNDVNGRPYFKLGGYGLWYDGLGHWFISLNSAVGMNSGFARYSNDVFCPHQISEWNWFLAYCSTCFWAAGNNEIMITCMCTYIKNKTESEFHIKRLISMTFR